MGQGLIRWLLNWLTGGIVDKVLGFVSNFFAAKADSERTQADVAKVDIAARERIVSSEVASPVLVWPRFLIEISLGVYLAKFWAFDKVICRFHDFGTACITDSIGGEAGTWAGYVIVGMFGASIADRVVGRLTGR